MKMIEVVFLCLGNICRSPMAEAVFRDLVDKENLSDKISVDSAGTASWHTGKPPHEGTRAKLDEKTISYYGMTARQISENDFNDKTYVVAMDDQNLKDIKNTYNIENALNVKKLMDFVDKPKETNIPDPYYTGNFDYTYELVTEGCEQLLNYIKKIHNL